MDIRQWIATGVSRGLRGVLAGAGLSLLAVAVSGCDLVEKLKEINGVGEYGVSGPAEPGEVDPRSLLQPDPSELASCNGDALLPALGMRFVPAGEPIPATGRFIREQSLQAPYRILGPNSVATRDYRPNRLNVDIDGNWSVIRVWCG